MADNPDSASRSSIEHSDPAGVGGGPVVVTGGAGFLGQLLVDRLRGLNPRRQITIVDRVSHPDTSIPSIVADLAEDPGAIEAVLAEGPATVFHLASVVSAAAEEDWSEAIRVNVAGLTAFVEACRRSGHRHRLVFTSSVAVFGGDFATFPTGDTTKQTPTSTYGMTKAFGELVVDDAHRKGFVDGRTARLPTVIVRPGAPNAAASGFLSGLFREPLQGLECRLPVSPETAAVVISPRMAVAGLHHLSELDGSRLGSMRAVGLPGITVTVADMLEVLERLGGSSARQLVTAHPDPAIAAIVGGWPARWDDRRARELGFEANTDLDEIVTEFINDHLTD